MIALEYIINLILTALLAIVSFFLKRTIDDVDGLKKDVSRVKLDYTPKDEVDCLKKEVSKVKLDYTPKEDFKELEGKIDKLSEKVNEVQLNYISKDDFFMKMADIARTLERMEGKVDDYGKRN